MRVEQVQALIIAHIIGRVLAAMNAAVAQCQQGLVQPVGVVRIGEEIHITGRTHHLMRGERQPADQGGPGFAVGKCCHCLLNLIDQA